MMIKSREWLFRKGFIHRPFVLLLVTVPVRPGPGTIVMLVNKIDVDGRELGVAGIATLLRSSLDKAFGHGRGILN